MRSVLTWLVLIGLLLAGCGVVAIDQPANDDGGATLQALQAATATAEGVPTLRQSLGLTPQPGSGQAGERVGPAQDVAPPPVATSLPAIPSTDADAIEQLLVNVYRRVSPAVVHVEITGPDTVFGPQSGAGSGFVLDQGGNIVTNNHVIESAQRIGVVFADDTRVDAELVGRDPAIDLAVIRVSVPKDVLVPVELGNSDRLQVGQRAIAIGNPFAFDQSMTVGIVSAIGRVVNPSEGSDLVPELIQTDAAINPGNSGGPLLDSRGRVIGINTLIFSETGTSAGVGFAVPVNTLRRSLPALLEGRQVGRPWLGIAGPPELDAALADELGLNSTAGAYVNYVFPGGPADEAGIVGASGTSDGTLQPGGDLVVAVDGVAVKSFDDLLDHLSKETRVGQSVKLTIVRGEQSRIVSVTLGERPDSQ